MLDQSPANGKRVADVIRELGCFIDHACLKPGCTLDDVRGGCRIASAWHTASVCVNSDDLATVVKVLKFNSFRTPVPCAVANFPLGKMDERVWMAELACVLQMGAREVDTVMNIGQYLSGDYLGVASSLRNFVHGCKSMGGRDVVVKVIIETGILKSAENIRRASLIVEDSGADYVKTSTGFGPPVDLLRDVGIIRAIVPDMKVKAAGGITGDAAGLKLARDLLAMGVRRLGCSATDALMNLAVMEASA